MKTALQTLAVALSVSTLFGLAVGAQEETVPQTAWGAPDQPLFEYACHEGNYGMYNILAIAQGR